MHYMFVSCVLFYLMTETMLPLALRFFYRTLASRVNIMEPKVIEIEGRNYRLFEKNTIAARNNAAAAPIEQELRNPDRFIDVEIVHKGTSYKHSFYVPKPFFRFLTGPEDSNLKKLERDTQTLIRVPNKLDKNADVEITSDTPMRIVSARHRISMIVENSRQKLKFTHFLAIPMRNETITSNFEKFKEDILNKTGKNSEGVQEGIFQKPEKMHLTLGMLVLVDNSEIQTAIEALKECHETVIKPMLKIHGFIKIKVRGVDSFKNKGTTVNVLFGKVSSENDQLQELVEKIADFFATKGFMKKEHDKVNLHLTLMNTTFMRNKKRSHSQSRKKFDASNILKVHKDYFFGETILNTIQICELGPRAEDGYYRITLHIDIDKGS